MTIVIPSVIVIASVFAVSIAKWNCGDQPVLCWSSESNFPQFPTTVPCYDGNLCMCSNTTANCSLTRGKLAFVPFLNQTYQVLNFSYNNLSRISDINFFLNASLEVQVIDLYHNGLVHIVEGVFQRLKKLNTLLLGGYNHLGFKDMPSLLSIPNLLYLGLSCVGLNAIPMHAFQKNNDSNIIYLNLNLNHIGSLNMSVFQPLPNLTDLTLWQNQIYQLETASLPTVEFLNFDTNRLFDFPQTCSRFNESLFPRLRNLHLNRNMIQCIVDPVCLPSLKELKLNFNNFMYFTTNTFMSERFPSLRELDIMQMENKILLIEPFFINNSAVLTINFMINNVDFDSNIVHKDVFGGCTNVANLLLNSNNFQTVTEKTFYRLLLHMNDSLTSLYLSKTQITHVSPDMFSQLRNLRTLYLYGNLISFIPDGSFDNLPHLEVLFLDNNIIASISEAAFSPHLRSRLRRLTLGSNPFQCSCEILWLQRWMKSNPILFRDYHEKGYRCSNMNNVSLPHYVLDNQACLLSSDAAILTIAVTCLLIFFLLLFTIRFRFRWHMRLWLYQVCRGRRQRSRGRRFKYDVFVSYAEEDKQWVEHELLPMLEDEWGFRLCVHQRDFVPGKHIVDNISDCVDNSDRVLLVFSPDFARSEWCQFELKFCQSCVMERDDVMVLVALQDTESRDMTGAMMAVLRTTTYIQWDEHEEARASFWGRLRLALDDTDEMVV